MDRHDAQDEFKVADSFTCVVFKPTDSAAVFSEQCS
jgi:hypothetical protein